MSVKLLLTRVNQLVLPKPEDPIKSIRVMMGTLVYFVMLQEMLYGKEILPLEKERLVHTLTGLITNQAAAGS